MITIKCVRVAGKGEHRREETKNLVILFLHLCGGYGWVFTVLLLNLFLDHKYILFYIEFQREAHRNISILEVREVTHCKKAWNNF